MQFFSFRKLIIIVPAGVHGLDSPHSFGKDTTSLHWWVNEHYCHNRLHLLNFYCASWWLQFSIKLLLPSPCFPYLPSIPRLFSSTAAGKEHGANAIAIAIGILLRFHIRFPYGSES